VVSRTALDSSRSASPTAWRRYTPLKNGPGAVVKGAAMKPLIVSLLAFTALSVGQGKQTFNGVITDDMCANADHARMRMGPTAAECTTACVSAHAAAYVLFDGKNVYTLSDQQMPEKFAGQDKK
jgi:hypothetical protein